MTLVQFLEVRERKSAERQLGVHLGSRRTLAFISAGAGEMLLSGCYQN